MGEFIVAHKIALLLIGAALGGFVLLTRGKSAGAANGVPVNPYAANAPNNGGGAGSFSLGDLLPAGPAGPALDPAGENSGSAEGPVAGQAPAAIDNAPATPGTSNGIDALQGTSFASTPYDQLPTSIQDGLRLGYPIQPNGSVLESDVTSPEAIPADSTFGNGRSLEHFGPLPQDNSDAVSRYLANTSTLSTLSAGSVASGPGTAPAVSLPMSSGTRFVAA